MATMNADPALLERVADELDNIASEMTDQQATLHDAASHTAAAWQSRYTGEFLDSVNSTNGEIRKTADAVRSAANRLRTIAREVRRAEAEIKALNAGVGGKR